MFISLSVIDLVKCIHN